MVYLLKMINKKSCLPADKQDLNDLVKNNYLVKDANTALFFTTWLCFGS